MDFKQMKFRIANPDQFDDLVDSLLGLGWGFRNSGQEATAWKISRRYNARFIYTCVLDNPTRYVLDYGISDSYFVESADDYLEMDTREFIRATREQMMDRVISEAEAAGEADYRRALTEYAQRDIVVDYRHPHHDVMVALANDSRTIVEVLRRDGKWVVTDSPVFNPSQQFRIGKTNLEKIIDNLLVEIDGDPDKLNQARSALSNY